MHDALYAGLMQWKRLLSLVLNSDEAALTTHAQLFAQIMRSLQAQLTFALHADQNDDKVGAMFQGGSLSPVDMLGLGDSLAALLEESFLRTHLLQFLARLSAEQASLEPSLQVAVRPSMMH